MGWFWTKSNGHDVMVDNDTHEVIHVCDNDD